MSSRSVMSLCILMLGLLSGCTQYNGYIGPIFGSWALEEISEDGDSLPLDGHTVLSFQNEVVRVVHIVDSYQNVTRYGNFVLADDVLSLTFLTELTSEGKGKEFLMPSWLYFPSGQMPLRFDVVKLNGSSMELSLFDGERVYLYKFDRTW